MSGGRWRFRSTGDTVASGDAAVGILRSSIDAGRFDIWFECSTDKSVSITTNGRGAMLILWGRAGHDEGTFAVDSGAGIGEQGGYVLANGQHDTYPDAQTVLLHDAVEAVRHIVDHGTIDPRLQWERWT